MNREVAHPATEVRELEAMIDEVAAAAADMATLLNETVVALGELLAERRSHAADAASDRSADTGRDLLGPDVLEVATLDAHAAGVSVAEYVRTAVLEYAARAARPSVDGNGADNARSRAARERARRLTADSTAARAQNAQTTARAAQLLEARSETSRQNAERKRGPAAERPDP
jgi:hypothetical protein